MLKTVVVKFACIILAHLGQCSGAKHEHMLGLYNSRFGNVTKGTQIRPLLNQDNILEVTVNFSPITVVEVDEVMQKFTCSGYVSLKWIDEIIPWSPDDYGNITEISPDIHDIWKPRVLLKNSFDDLNPIDDKQSTLYVQYNGSTGWYPGGVFATSCTLNMVMYPFDEHECSLEFYSMQYKTNQLKFKPESPIMSDNTMYKNSAWDLKKTEIRTNVDFVDKEYATACVSFIFTIRRRSSGIMYTIIIPEMFISFLNVLVFFIPTESGEKLSYGITVLLAQAVFMTILMGQLPKSSTTVPYIAVYMFCLISIAVFSVVCSIAVVFLHHKDKEERSNRDKKKKNEEQYYVRDLHRKTEKSTQLGQPRTDKKTCIGVHFLDPRDRGNTLGDAQMDIGKWQIAAKWMNAVSCVLCFLGLISLTLWYLISVTKLVL